MDRKITRIMLQCCPRMDSITALYLLQREGGKKYPGVGTAKIEFWATGTQSPDGKTWRQYLEEGTILIGVGGGPFDEHPSPEFGDRKEGLCSATSLVAQDLGIHKNPRYRLLIKTVTENDLGMVSTQDAMSNIIKMGHRLKDMPADRIIHWVFFGLDIFVEDQQGLQDAVKEFDEHHRINTVQIGGRDCRVAFVCSNSLSMLRAARYRDKSINALILRRQSGHTQIFCTQSGTLDMSQVVRHIRLEELKARNQSIPANDGVLEKAGQHPLVSQWCYQQPGENLLNGSETAPGVEKTALPVERIRDIVCEHVKFTSESREPADAVTTA